MASPTATVVVLSPDAEAEGTGSAGYRGQRVVFQVFAAFAPIDVAPLPIERTVPQITVWGDGRVLFIDDDRVLRQSTLDTSVFAALVDRADALYGMSDYLSDAVVTDAVLPRLVVSTGRGVKSVTGLGAGIQPFLDEFAAFMPSDATPYEPDVLSFRTRLLVLNRGTPIEGTWPFGTDGVLSGDRAVRALALVGPGLSALFRQGSSLLEVALTPMIETIDPRYTDPARIGIRHHPAAGLMLGTGDWQLFGATGEQAAAWFRRVMAEGGWRFANEEEGSQTWIDEDNPYAAIVDIRFSGEGYAVGASPLYYGGDIRPLPQHPLATSDWLNCVGGSDGDCQTVFESGVEEVESWFSERLPYLGWEPVEPDVYERSGLRGTTRIGVTYEPWMNNNVRVTFELLSEGFGPFPTPEGAGGGGGPRPSDDQGGGGGPRP